MLRILRPTASRPSAVPRARPCCAGRRVRCPALRSGRRRVICAHGRRRGALKAAQGRASAESCSLNRPAARRTRTRRHAKAPGSETALQLLAAHTGRFHVAGCCNAAQRGWRLKSRKGMLRDRTAGACGWSSTLRRSSGQALRRHASGAIANGLQTSPRGTSAATGVATDRPNLQNDVALLDCRL